MAFKCPECSNPRSLKIIEVIELPPDNRSDEITLQLIKCTNCSFKGLAVYEESRRGEIGREFVSHIGYKVNRAKASLLRKYIHNCPNPKNIHCNCDTHQMIGTKDQNGRWNGLAKFEIGEGFILQYHMR